MASEQNRPRKLMAPSILTVKHAILDTLITGNDWRLPLQSISIDYLFGALGSQFQFAPHYYGLDITYLFEEISDVNHQPVKSGIDRLIQI